MIPVDRDSPVTRRSRLTPISFVKYSMCSDEKAGQPLSRLGTGQKVQGGGGGVGRSMRKSEGPKTHDPPSFMGIKSADPPPGSG